MYKYGLIGAVLISSFASIPLKAEQPKGPQHGLELYGTPKYPADFKNFDYVNPSAPKGGELRMSGFGTFDSLNPFVIKGIPAAGMTFLHPSYLYATLMEHSYDEPSSVYGYIAETAEVAEDKKSVTFTLRDSARFHDGTPITAEDVVFTFDILMKKGNPMFRAYYRKIKGAEALGPRIVRFNFSADDDKELPMIIGEMPILSKAFYAKHDFAKADLSMPLGSGPYTIENVDPGKSVTYKRVKDWWGADLPVNKGRYNFDTIKLIYFRDLTVALEAFKAGDISLRSEYSAKDWANDYDSPAFRNGDYIKREIPHTMPAGMMGLIFNIRQPLFQDRNVRKALSLAFDFEWANKNLFYNSYTRHNSYFSNGELASTSLPTGDELKILEPFKGQIPEEVFAQEFKMPVNANGHHIREQMKIARQLLKDAGWGMKDGVLVNKKTGQPFEFEILIKQPDLAKVINGFVQNLNSLGVKAKIRVVDTAQYTERVNDFDYDMIFEGFPQSNTPGNEQEEFWGSKSADAKGSTNYIGVKDPVVDALVEEIIHAQSRESLISHVHALDRVLLWNYYMVPGYYLPGYRVAYWKDFHSPEVIPKYNLDLNAWWFEEKK
jgi:microcin C transport system substrate-binding protein